LGLVWGAVVWGWGLICLWCGGGVGLFLVAGNDADWFGGIPGGAMNTSSSL
jgi:hypothetical protein